MADTSGVTFDEDGYCGVTLEDIATVFPLSKQPGDSSEFVEEDDKKKKLLIPFSTGNIDAMHQLASNISINNTPLSNIRRIVWGYFLGVYDAPDVYSLVKDIETKRSQYRGLVSTHRIDNISDIKSLDPQLFHPLAPVERNPWELSQRSRQLLDEIWQDVERTYQERSLFTSDPVRKTLQRVLYIWSKEHLYISYKQGMNELLAIIYLVCYRGQLLKEEASTCLQYSKLFSSDENDIEADVYTLFNGLMSLEMQLMYDTAAEKAPSMKVCPKTSLNLERVAFESEHTKSETRNSYIARTGFIYSVILKEYDEALFNHLKSIGIEAHVFLMRWIRLIFSREFNLNNSLHLWDAVFADHFLGKLMKKELPQFEMEMIDFLAVAMISFIRHNLLENDLTHCLQRLFKFPPIEDMSHLISKAQKIRMAFRNGFSQSKEDKGTIFRSSTGSETDKEDKEENDSTGSQMVRNIPAKQGKPGSSFRGHSKSDAYITYVDKRYSSTATSMTGNSDATPHGSKTPAISLQSVKRELEHVASRVYKMYGHPLIAKSEDFMNEIQVVHSKLVHIISELDP